MAKFKIITQKGCAFCKKLKEWLADKNVDWEEIDIDDPGLNESVLNDDYFTARYCDMSQCIDSTPIIIKGEKDYYYGEIWDYEAGTIKEDKAKRLFGL